MNTDPLYHYVNLCEGAIYLYQEAEARLRKAQNKDTHGTTTAELRAGKFVTLVRTVLSTHRGYSNRGFAEQALQMEKEGQDLTRRADLLAKQAIHVRTYLHPVHRARADKELSKNNALSPTKHYDTAATSRLER